MTNDKWKMENLPAFCHCLLPSAFRLLPPSGLLPLPSGVANSSGRHPHNDRIVWNIPGHYRTRPH